jgi:hypothetical protein
MRLAERVRQMMATPIVDPSFALTLDDVGLVLRSKYARYLPMRKKAEARALGLRMLHFIGLGGASFMTTAAGRAACMSAEAGQ